ncbi:hypothetical protein T484DRAFT_1850320 [Baffinella frigidus]|nr:hypothetical protein T484DRAFT_1850320 [Cryptophyta sp. CCMP2293]
MLRVSLAALALAASADAFAPSPSALRLAPGAAASISRRPMAASAVHRSRGASLNLSMLNSMPEVRDPLRLSFTLCLQPREGRRAAPPAGSTKAGMALALPAARQTSVALQASSGTEAAKTPTWLLGCHFLGQCRTT